MTNQRKIAGAALTLALSAFGVDRFGLGPAAPAAAPTSDSPPPRGPGRHSARESAGKTPEKLTAPVDRSLAARLEAVGRAELAGDDDAPTPDAFKPSSLWYPAPTAPAPKQEKASAAASASVLADFRARHHLSAVMRSAQGGIAIIGGKVYVPGQSLDGFVVSSIDPGGVVLKQGEASVVLTIDLAGATAAVEITPEQ